MKYRISMLCSLLLLSMARGQGFKPAGGFVPDAATALKIAEAVLIPVYGKETIKAEEPFTAKLKATVWTVEGTLHCPDGARHCEGGVAIVEVSKTDGRILLMNHGK